MNIFIIGDSISIHYGPALEASLKGAGIGYDRKSGRDAARQNMDVARGANGGDSAMVLAYLQHGLDAGAAITADTLLINCGLHDIKTDPATGARQVPLETYRKNLDAIAKLVTRTLARRLVWIRTTPCDERIHNARCSEFHRFAADCEAYNRAADAVMAAHAVPVIDLYTFTRNLDLDLFCDHVHFAEPVRRLQAAFISGWLQAFRATVDKARA
jgi:lysophospholipase L1-like esterase